MGDFVKAIFTFHPYPVKQVICAPHWARKEKDPHHDLQGLVVGASLRGPVLLWVMMGMLNLYRTGRVLATGSE